VAGSGWNRSNLTVNTSWWWADVPETCRGWLAK
jgi:hypothetical protein